MSGIEAAFDGEIVVLRDTPWRELADRAAELIRQHLDGDPLTAHQRMSKGAYLSANEEIRTAIKADDRIRRHFRQGIEAAGLSPDETFRDRLILRGQPPRGVHAARETMQLPAHRDNWGSGIAQQLNWWMPVLPISADRTLWLYPDLFDQVVPNDSADWSFEAILAEVKAGRAELTTPQARAPVDPDLAVPLMLQPGEMAVFSGAQLHQSAPNTGDLARFNFETRTVSLNHVSQGIGAEMPDAAPQGPYWRWFRHMETGQRMDRSESLSEALLR